jgi:hypothetical protein
MNYLDMGYFAILPPAEVRAASSATRTSCQRDIPTTRGICGEARCKVPA